MYIYIHIYIYVYIYTHTHMHSSLPNSPQIHASQKSAEYQRILKSQGVIPRHTWASCWLLRIFTDFWEFSRHEPMSWLAWLSKGSTMPSSDFWIFFCQLCCRASGRRRSQKHTSTYFNALQRTATHCNALQHTAMHCKTLQHTATQCNILKHTHAHLWGGFD